MKKLLGLMALTLFMAVITPQAEAQWKIQKWAYDGDMAYTLKCTKIDSMATVYSPQFDASAFNGQTNIGIGINYRSASVNDSALFILQGQLPNIDSTSGTWVNIDTFNVATIGVVPTTTSSVQWATVTISKFNPPVWRICIKPYDASTAGTPNDRNGKRAEIYIVPPTLDVITAKQGILSR